MFAPASRRAFLRSAAGAAAITTLPQLDFLGQLPRVSAQDAKPDPKSVQFNPEIEPLVQLLEETPRNKLLEAVGAKVKGGTTYREVLAALLLAGVRNIQPRPSVGFKFHAVLVVNSAHLAAMSSPDEHRWLPIFWALDEFKGSQARDVQEGDWTMSPVNEERVPPAHLAKQQFIEAMDQWDEAKADAAVAALARTASSNELFDIFSRYGARDFRSIGHKAIYVANSWRTLHCIGWQHAEPVLRSLAYALLNHQGEGNPAQNDFTADRPMRDNLSRVKKIRPEWQDGKLDEQATKDILATVYGSSSSDMCELVVEMLNKGVAPQSIWDGLLCGAGELLMRQPGIVGIHTLTTTNALRYAYETAGDDETRQLMLLQNAAFLPMFRQGMVNRGKIQERKLLELQPAESTAGASMEDIFAKVSGNRMEAASLTLGYAMRHEDPKAFIDHARTLIFLKGNDSHDYKFSSAVLEDYAHVSRPWRDRFLATSVFNLTGSGDRDNPLVERTRAALA
ncbi:MAG TPA: hypothetical protein VMP01_25285 [Pirellulaceae bacterium]|nr:hypothetical protein [Pirellulaceae bacterium]